MRVDSGGEDREEGRGMRGERRDEDGREDERERSERERELPCILLLTATMG